MSSPSIDFKTAIEADVALVTGVDSALVSVYSLIREGSMARAVVSIRNCDVSSSTMVTTGTATSSTNAADTSSSSNANPHPAATSDMTHVYSAWAAVESSLSSGGFMTQSNAAQLGGQATADAMYDPNCTENCPAGKDPFSTDTDDKGHGGDDGFASWKIVLTVVGAVAGITMCHLRRRCIRKRRREQREQRNTANADDQSTATATAAGTAGTGTAELATTVSTAHETPVPPSYVSEAYNEPNQDYKHPAPPPAYQPQQEHGVEYPLGQPQAPYDYTPQPQQYQPQQYQYPSYPSQQPEYHPYQPEYNYQQQQQQQQQQDGSQPSQPMPALPPAYSVATAPSADMF
jgi:hypothetical protein